MLEVERFRFFGGGESFPSLAANGLSPVLRCGTSLPARGGEVPSRRESAAGPAEAPAVCAGCPPLVAVGAVAVDAFFAPAEEDSFASFGFAEGAGGPVAEARGGASFASLLLSLFAAVGAGAETFPTTGRLVFVWSTSSSTRLAAASSRERPLIGDGRSTRALARDGPARDAPPRRSSYGFRTASSSGAGQRGMSPSVPTRGTLGDRGGRSPSLFDIVFYHIRPTPTDS